MNADKSKATLLGTANQLRYANGSKSVTESDFTLDASPELKSTVAVLDQRLIFNNQATAVVKACNFHTEAVITSGRR